MADKINLSYIFQIEEKYIPRISQADYIFIHDWKHKVPSRQYAGNDAATTCSASSTLPSPSIWKVSVTDVPSVVQLHPS